MAKGCLLGVKNVIDVIPLQSLRCYNRQGYDKIWLYNLKHIRTQACHWMHDFGRPYQYQGMTRSLHVYVIISWKHFCITIPLRGGTHRSPNSVDTVKYMQYITIVSITCRMFGLASVPQTVSKTWISKHDLRIGAERIGTCSARSHYLDQYWRINIWVLRINGREISIKMQTFPFKEMYSKMSAALCRPFFSGLDVLSQEVSPDDNDYWLRLWEGNKTFCHVLLVSLSNSWHSPQHAIYEISKRSNLSLNNPLFSIMKTSKGLDSTSDNPPWHSILALSLRRIVPVKTWA